jgi:hypothetical protein
MGVTASEGAIESHSSKKKLNGFFPPFLAILCWIFRLFRLLKGQIDPK